MRTRSRRTRAPAGRRLASPGGGAAFTPASLSGLALWLDPTFGLFQERTGASAATPAVDDGDPVGTWAARTGQFFVAPSDAARPTLRLSGGVPYLEFDGSDDRLSHATARARPFTAGLASRTRTGNAGRTLSGPSNVADNWLLGAHATTPHGHYAGSAVDGAGSLDVWARDVATDLAGTSPWFHDGSAQGDAGGTNVWGASLSLGGLTDQEFGAVDVSAVVLYSRALTAAELAPLDAFLAAGHP